MDTSEPTDPSPHGSVAADELRTDEPRTDVPGEAAPGEPRTDEPRTDEPRTDAPGETAPGEPRTAAPGEPRTDEPRTDEPRTDAPGEAEPPGEAAPPPDGGDDAPFPGLTWGKVAVLGLALMFLGFAVGFVVTRDRPPASDSADVGFLQDMITHHDQALGVATLTVAYGEDPTVRSYAMEVLTFQSYEIGVMTQTLAGWGFSRGDRSDEAMAWMDMGVPVEQMPGLLSEEDLDRIGDARGAEIDSLFLELMSEHHRGGIHMAQEAASRVDDDEVAELAARMERNQAGEINEYRVTAETLGLDLDIEPAAVPPADLPPSGD